MHVVLVEPEIHVNTGNIARTCVCTGTPLHLVHPLGFSIDARAVRRAGLDYWHLLDLHEWTDFAALRRAYPTQRFLFIETVGQRRYDEVAYRPDDFLVFGRETKGLPQALLEGECVVRIPMVSPARSLNLSNCVALVLYEALRQCGFPQLR
ncbi:MAG: tRNA (cytidine(34)-2'-O)-methyltransferase [Chloracidobacterium sp.]|uniref:Putative tRNA (cytidine(34)-2'-O)-methyltransferase n=1 Tax=Chloracidobacterium validum TaxID=2821543 RepID=A0ABX8BBL5_9BACT|nr:tRNA (cytidine(34)-2'-O)-methyltransferase [Chloracidobacterium validum]QUW03797.1 tRNA (cytidine(34)-2'-O)-methyltransferase [Chloracidobacterium validum]